MFDDSSLIVVFDGSSSANPLPNPLPIHCQLAMVWQWSSSSLPIGNGLAVEFVQLSGIGNAWLGEYWRQNEV
jgi:hypothetical protein